MNIILLGPPGARKGTQAELLCDQLNNPRISTGDLLREEITAGSAIGKQVKDLIANGALVPEEIVVQLLMNRIARSDCSNGFLLDGFPRTIQQAEILEHRNIKI